ncbi:2-oxoglutarate dehydrogenase, E2 component, dihydrolipoamide succinyltransferase [Cellulomonas fimi]|uniref:Dihydrolipoamide acetyltransferase component of pyruvate dehydrogenase complex n=1 Tax=Cellulomonas fimi TaxID=1708 RepID=A0A7Y0QIW5_CELFI|nr:2-oxoglutarate dehydrogenase, E2 component, dihydrolipoamide succinyltransferase [Cellulomonas fimi]NMR21314.1 2-oxoglutarate dehydrogenase, E2 component, dihydrolipoamide succinyltransferase [Cellulomonas fimi]
MSDSVQMPALGESVTEGTVTRWLKNVGDTIAVDEPLLEVSTDKVDTEIPSPFAGVLEQILVQEDETVEVGAALAVIGSGEGGGGGDAEPEQSQESEQPAQQAAQQPAQDQAAEAGSSYGDPEPEAEVAPRAEQPASDVAPQAGQPASDAAPQAGQPASGDGQGGDDQPGGGQGGAAQGGGGSDGSQVTMPALGESVTEGTVTRWLKSVGDDVAVDEPLLEVSTDKVDTEIPSPFAGTLQQIFVQEDETVEVGAPLALIGSGAAGTAPAAPSGSPTAQAPAPARTDADPQVAAPDEAAAPPPEQAPAQQPPARPAQPQQAQAPAAQAPAPAAASVPAQAAPAQAAPAPSASGSYLTPLVRKLAAEKGVDVSTLTGTGVGGRIRKEDVLEAAAKAEAAKAEAAKAAPATSAAAPAAAAPKPAAPAISPLRGTTEKMTRLRKLVASRMVESMQTSAQLTTVVEVDATKIARLRARAKADFQAREGVNLTFLPFFALAAVEALKTYPKVNASIDGDQIVYHDSENLGIAVDTERGLVVPVIKGAGDLNLAGIARKIADLASRTRANKVGPDDLAGGTFTITNTGSGGALIDTPIVAMPQVAILGTGTIVKRPVVVKDADGADTIAIRSMMYLFLSYDHRLVDGADAARYLAAVKNRIEEGAFESELGL